jgi:aerobic C4-dicarboxylate transport protein
MSRWFRSLYFWVISAILGGALLGIFSPSSGMALQPLADGFVRIIKFLVGPVIFCSVAVGIAGSDSKKDAGRIALKAFVYFEVVSTLALAIGLVVANLLKPGVGFPLDPSRLDAGLIAAYTSPRGHLLNPLDGINLIQILVLSIVSGVTLLFAPAGFRSRSVSRLKRWNHTLFVWMGKLMLLAPVGAGAAMAYTTGKFGADSLRPLLFLMFCFYLTCSLFIFGVLGAIARLCGVPILSYLRYLKAEILLVLGTSSSESALAPLMEKLERLGCPRSVVGLVVPTGYSFNLDGTNIYLTLAAVFIAQAFGIDLSLTQQLGILLVAMVSSKGASGVTGAGFITLAATLAIVPEIPVAGLTLILGVDRFMSEARALTNMLGNGIATLVVSRWEGRLDSSRMIAELGHPHRGMLDA